MTLWKQKPSSTACNNLVVMVDGVQLQFENVVRSVALKDIGLMRIVGFKPRVQFPNEVVARTLGAGGPGERDENKEHPPGSKFVTKKKARA